MNRHCKVTVIDMDYQQSISQKYQRAKLLENAEPYEVIAAGLEDYPRLLPVLNENPEDLALIDLPRKLDDDGLMPVFRSADLVFCPFSYDEFSFESTVLFSVVLNKSIQIYPSPLFQTGSRPMSDLKRSHWKILIFLLAQQLLPLRQD